MPHPDFVARCDGKNGRPDAKAELFNDLDILPKLNPTDAVLALRLQFDTRYRLRPPPGQAHRPFSGVEMYDSERIDRNDLRLASMKRFARNQIHSLFGHSYEDFTNMPAFYVDWCHEIAEEIMKAKAQGSKELEAQLSELRKLQAQQTQGQVKLS